ncbi:YkgJ family cysteine cluster protein [Dokdonella sp.]|uniref:YkgJ family cysteine cluster protein n=1 Tax=Dokdonella sp. TaxID=2291710 RepID=UPI0025C543DF|nr:YkgJ family cysteine cluster protein [Dokdonella sp.]MBX3691509.1 YkgJ family cysteine cluster protein [Dokdonella sp.]
MASIQRRSLPRMSHDIAAEYRRTGLAEHATAMGELAQGDPLRAVTASYRRHERIFDAALAESGAKLDCRAGCAWCCHYKVDVRADEALAIVEHVRTRLDAATRERVIDAARRNAATIRALTPAQHMTTNLACCFLVEGACSIYPARPFACRNHHSTDVEMCRAEYESPGRTDLPDSSVPLLKARCGGHREGRQSAVLHSGLDVRAYDLTTAFLDVLDNASASRRLRQGKRALIEAIVVD